MQRTISWLASAFMLAVAVFGNQTTQKIDFRRDVAPYSRAALLSECHYSGHLQQRPSSQPGARNSSHSGSVVPGEPKQSFFYNCMVDGWMPPAGKIDGAQNWQSRSVTGSPRARPGPMTPSLKKPEKTVVSRCPTFSRTR
jgi:hypothetical protein